MRSETSKDFLISLEGIGAAGKSVQSRMLFEALSHDYDIVAGKMIDRKSLEDSLYAYRNEPHEQLWVTNLPDVEPGVDMLAFMALLKQRYVEISRQVASPKIVILDRYVDTVFAHAAARVVLGGIPQQEKAELTGLYYPKMDEQGLCKRMALKIEENGDKIGEMYSAFEGLKSVIKWPDVTIVIDVPLSEASKRGTKRENRPYSEDDFVGFCMIKEIYKFLKEKENKRIRLLDGSGDQKNVADSIAKIIYGHEEIKQCLKQSKTNVPG